MLRNGFHLFKDALSDLFFPPVCSFCESASVESGASLCEDCRDSIDRVGGPICIQCGLPIPGLSLAPSGRCGRCLTDPPRYERARYGVYYQGTVRDALLRLKFAGALHIAPALSLILTEAFRRHFESGDFDLIVPVPIHRTRLIRRGFNQVVELGKRLSKDTGIPLDRTSFQKVKDTAPQVGLTRAARVKNLRGSFGVKRPDRIRGRNILLVDDVRDHGFNHCRSVQDYYARRRCTSRRAGPSCQDGGFDSDGEGYDLDPAGKSHFGQVIAGGTKAIGDKIWP